MARKARKVRKDKSTATEEQKTAAKGKDELTEDQLTTVAGGVGGSIVTEGGYLKLQQGSVVTEKVGGDGLAFHKISPDALVISPDIAPTNKFLK